MAKFQVDMSKGSGDISIYDYHRVQADRQTDRLHTKTKVAQNSMGIIFSKVTIPLSRLVSEIAFLARP